MNITWSQKHLQTNEFPPLSQGIIQRERLLQYVMEWRKRLEGGEGGGGRGGVPKCGPDWSLEMGQWLASIRLDGLQLSPASGLAS